MLKKSVPRHQRVSFTVLLWTSPEPRQGYLIREQFSVINIKSQFLLCNSQLFNSVSFLQETFSSAFSQIGMILFFSQWCWGFQWWETWPRARQKCSPGFYVAVGHIDKQLWNQIADVLCHRSWNGGQACEILCKEHSFYVFIAYKMPGEFPSKSNHC